MTHANAPAGRYQLVVAVISIDILHLAPTVVLAFRALVFAILLASISLAALSTAPAVDYARVLQLDLPTPGSHTAPELFAQSPSIVIAFTA